MFLSVTERKEILDDIIDDIIISLGGVVTGAANPILKRVMLHDTSGV